MNREEDDPVRRLPVIQGGVATAPDPDLTAAGWVRRFMVGDDRLAEVVTLYRELGCEVRVEPVAAERSDPLCHGCLSSGPTMHVVYTRPRSDAGALPPPREE